MCPPQWLGWWAHFGIPSGKWQVGVVLRRNKAKKDCLQWSSDEEQVVQVLDPVSDVDAVGADGRAAIAAAAGFQPPAGGQFLDRGSCLIQVPVASGIHEGAHQVRDLHPLRASGDAGAAVLTVKAPAHQSCDLKIALLLGGKAQVAHDVEVHVHLLEGGYSGDRRAHVFVAYDPFEGRGSLPCRPCPCPVRLSPARLWLARKISPVYGCFCHADQTSFYLESEKILL